MGVFEFLDMKVKRNVVPGFMNLRVYVQAMQLPQLEEKEKTRYTPNGMRKPQRIKFTNVDAVEKGGQGNFEKGAFKKVIKRECLRRFWLPFLCLTLLCKCVSRV